MEQLLIASYALIWEFFETLKEWYYAAGLIPKCMTVDYCRAIWYILKLSYQKCIAKQEKGK